MYDKCYTRYNISICLTTLYARRVWSGSSVRSGSVVLHLGPHTNNTPSQIRFVHSLNNSALHKALLTSRCETHGLIRRVGYKEATHAAKMPQWMLLREVICKIVSASAPFNSEMTLLDTVANPVTKTHINSLGHSLFDSIVGQAYCAFIVTLNRRRALGMSKVLQSIP